jgi:uncharacterized protein (TIGR02284 family)
MMKEKFTRLRKIALLVAPIAFFGCYHNSIAGQAVMQNQKSPKEVIKSLQDLTQYEIDASALISQCSQNLKNETLKSTLQTVKNEFDKNINDLTTLVKKFGGSIPEYDKDFKGYFMTGYAAMRGAFSDKGALNALHTNLKLIQSAFQKALNSPIPSDAKDVIKKISDVNQQAIDAIQNDINQL